jgi:hypothetical protein
MQHAILNPSEVSMHKRETNTFFGCSIVQWLLMISWCVSFAVYYLKWLPWLLRLFQVTDADLEQCSSDTKRLEKKIEPLNNQPKKAPRLFEWGLSERESFLTGEIILAVIDVLERKVDAEPTPYVYPKEHEEDRFLHIINSFAQFKVYPHPDFEVQAERDSGRIIIAMNPEEIIMAYKCFLVVLTIWCEQENSIYDLLPAKTEWPEFIEKLLTVSEKFPKRFNMKAAESALQGSVRWSMAGMGGVRRWGMEG